MNKIIGWESTDIRPPEDYRDAPTPLSDNLEAPCSLPSDASVDEDPTIHTDAAPSSDCADVYGDDCGDGYWDDLLDCLHRQAAADNDEEKEQSLSSCAAGELVPVTVIEDEHKVVSSETQRVCQAIEKLGLFADGYRNDCDISRASLKLIKAMIDSTPASKLDRFALLEAVQTLLARQQSKTESWDNVSAPFLCSLIDHIQSIGLD